MKQFMEAQGRVAAYSLFATFELGQLGALAEHDRDAARAMIKHLRESRDDIERGATDLVGTIDSIIANVEEHLDA